MKLGTDTSHQIQLRSPPVTTSRLPRFQHSRRSQRSRLDWHKWVACVAAVFFVLTAPALSDTATAEAKGKTSSKARAKKLAKHRAKKRAAKRSAKRPSKARSKKRRGAKKSAKKSKRKGKRKMKVKRRRGYRGHGVAKEDLRTEPLPTPSGDVWIYAENFREELKINIFERDGDHSQAALASLDKTFRCKRTQEERAADPRLYEVLSIIQDHFEGKRVVLTSGFRFQTNEGSRHFHASAMDIRVDDIPIRELYEFAESLDTGGMGIGIYPRSGFVHIDFRAPGEPSYRWTDNSRGRGSRGKSPSKSWKPKS